MLPQGGVKVTPRCRSYTLMHSKAVQGRLEARQGDLEVTLKRHVLSVRLRRPVACSGCWGARYVRFVLVCLYVPSRFRPVDSPPLTSCPPFYYSPFRTLVSLVAVLFSS